LGLELKKKVDLFPLLPWGLKGNGNQGKVKTYQLAVQGEIYGNNQSSGEKITPRNCIKEKIMEAPIIVYMLLFST